MKRKKKKLMEEKLNEGKWTVIVLCWQIENYLFVSSNKHVDINRYIPGLRLRNLRKWNERKWVIW